MASESIERSTGYDAGAEYFASRKQSLNQHAKQTGTPVYPHKFETTCTVASFLQAHHGLAPGEQVAEENVSIAGRVLAWRIQGKKLVFFHLRNDGYEVQVWLSASTYGSDDFDQLVERVRPNDIVGVTGYPARTKRSELSVVATHVELLSPCLRMVPAKLEDPNIRYRRRHLEGIVNHERLRAVLRTRSAVTTYLRNFFIDRGFLAVETALLHLVVGGAAARPFLTEVNATKETRGLRISPELELKKLVVAGMEKVFEIGPQFRNEGLDTTHNPSFTSIESYEAYVDYEDLMDMTEELLGGMVQKLKRSYQFTTMSLDGSGASVEVDFSPPFRRVPMIETLEQMLKVTFPRPLDSDACNAFLQEVCRERAVPIHAPHTTARLLDTLVGHYIEPTCVNPTFIMEHPQLMSPLAKYHRSKPELTERFELFVCGKELCNAYTELNDPHKQRECFEAQLKDRNQGDDEAQLVDADFVDALDHGLPPTGGWGMGIDRLVMLLTGHTSIKEVLAFPMMKAL